MARLSLATRKYFDIPYSVFSILLQMQGAIDPETGQIICQSYSLGVAVMDTPEGGVPFITIEDCLFITFGPQNVKLALTYSDAVEVENISVKHGQIVIGDLEVDSYWGLSALVFTKEHGGKMRLYKLKLAIDSEETLVAGILVEETDAGPALILIPRSCGYTWEQEQPPTHM